MRIPFLACVYEFSPLPSIGSLPPVYGSHQSGSRGGEALVQIDLCASFGRGVGAERALDGMAQIDGMALRILMEWPRSTSGFGRGVGAEQASNLRMGMRTRMDR